LRLQQLTLIFGNTVFVHICFCSCLFKGSVGWFSFFFGFHNYDFDHGVVASCCFVTFFHAWWLCHLSLFKFWLFNVHTLIWVYSKWFHAFDCLNLGYHDDLAFSSRFRFQCICKLVEHFGGSKWFNSKSNFKKFNLHLKENLLLSRSDISVLNLHKKIFFYEPSNFVKNNSLVSFLYSLTKQNNSTMIYMFTIWPTSLKNIFKWWREN